MGVTTELVHVHRAHPVHAPTYILTTYSSEVCIFTPHDCAIIAQGTAPMRCDSSVKVKP